MLTLNILLFLFSASALFFIVRYRVHIRISYEPRTGKNPRRRRQHREPADPPFSHVADKVPADVINEDLITSALIHLGAPDRAARGAARRAVAAGPRDDFNEMLKRAIREVQPPQRPPAA